MKDRVRIKKDTRQLINQAYIRDGRFSITGEAMLLACLLHSHGENRESEDFKDVQRIMGDINLDEE